MEFTFRCPAWLIISPAGKPTTASTQLESCLLIYTEEIFAERVIRDLGLVGHHAEKIPTNAAMQAIVEQFIQAGGTDVAIDKSGSRVQWEGPVSVFVDAIERS